jgi:F0F1-type ATP synthase assembly protein I
MIVLLLLGFAAGVRNIMRASAEMNAAAPHETAAENVKNEH